jgi:hypothetical protein
MKNMSTKTENKKAFVFYGSKISIPNQISLHPGGQSSYKDN